MHTKFVFIDLDFYRDYEVAIELAYDRAKGSQGEFRKLLSAQFEDELIGNNVTFNVSGSAFADTYNTMALDENIPCDVCFCFAKD